VVCTNRESGLVTPIFSLVARAFRLPYVREMKHFLGCVRSGSQPSVTGQAAAGRWQVCWLLLSRSFEERSVRLAEVLDAVPEVTEATR